MNKLVAMIYKKLIEQGRITPEDLPEGINIEPDKPAEEEPVDELYGAVAIPKIVRSIDPNTIENGTFTDTFTTYDIIRKPMIGDNPYPESIEYNIIRVEADPMLFRTKPDVKLINMQNGFEIQIKGHMSGKIPFDIIRIDVGINSSNYEPMRFSIYYKKA